MALGRPFSQDLGDDPLFDLIDLPPDDISNFWASAPETDVSEIWRRITPDLGDQRKPPGWLLRLLLPLADPRYAGAMAVMVLMIFATVGAFLAPGIPSPDRSLRGELSHLAVGASLALQDAQLAPAEIERLDATVADLDARLTDRAICLAAARSTTPLAPWPPRVPRCWNMTPRTPVR